MQFLLNHEFFIIFLIISFLFLILIKYFKINKLKLASIILFSIFCSLALAELYLSFYIQPIQLASYNKTLFDSKTIEKTFIKEHIKVFENDKRKRIEIRDNALENIQGKYYKVYDSTYTLYSNKIRYTKCNNSSDKSFLFLGCSFAFGEGLQDDETLPYYFSEQTNFQYNVVNCGIRGKSTNTILSMLRLNIIDKFLPNKKIDHVFYIIFADYLRNFRIESTNSASDNWIYYKDKWHRTKQPLNNIKLIFAKSYIFMAIFQTFIEQHYTPLYKDYFIDSLLEINTILEDKYNTKMTVVLYPDHLFYFHELQKLPLDIIVLDNKYDNFGEYRIQRDGHPTAKANKEIAQILIAHINNNNQHNN